jgi:hypothetical protein
MKKLEKFLSDFPEKLQKPNEVLTFRERLDEVDNGFHYLEHKPYYLLKKNSQNDSNSFIE